MPHQTSSAFHKSDPRKPQHSPSGGRNSPGIKRQTVTLHAYQNRGWGARQIFCYELSVVADHDALELVPVQQEHVLAEAMLNLCRRRPKFSDMSSTATPTFRHQISIAREDIDDMGHVNNAVYLRWVQEAVVDYWNHVSPAQAQAQLLWVALKHEITYRTPLLIGDQVTALVTATATRGSRATFTTQFVSGDRTAAEARSSWCCVDATTRRPRRIADEIATLFLPTSKT